MGPSRRLLLLTGGAVVIGPTLGKYILLEPELDMERSISDVEHAAGNRFHRQRRLSH